MTGKRVLLIVGGGIAAYKALELTRLLRRAGVLVRPILTSAGAQFVTPLSLSALAEDRVYTELFSLTDEAEMGHIQLSRQADLVVVAPATADLMAKAANGLAGDLAATTLLATDKPVLMAPAMNVRMWEHPATRRNVRQLQADGVRFVGPDDGAMACGEFGPGRMAEPPAILEAILAVLEPQAAAAKPLSGRRAIVTAGPTAEPLDPVRLLTNRSSGKQGYAIARALARLGVATLSTGPSRPSLVVGFAAETHDVEAHAQAKLARKGCDWIVANDVSVEGVMGGDLNTVAIVSADGVERWEKLAKDAVADRLAERMAAHFADSARDG